MKGKSSQETANKAGQTRERILDAAERCFAEKGFAGASMREITAEAGVNLSVAYYYFESKEKLLLQVFKRYLEPLLARQERELAQAREEAKGGPIPLPRLIELLTFVRDEGSESRMRLRAMFFSHRGIVEGEVCSLLNEVTETLRENIFREYARACPHLSSHEVRFRFACMHAILDGLELLAPFLERGLLGVPLIKGAYSKMLFSAMEGMFKASPTPMVRGNAEESRKNFT